MNLNSSIKKQCRFRRLRSCVLYIKLKTVAHWAGFVETCFVIQLNLLVDVFTQPKHISEILMIFFFLFMILFLPADTRIREILNCTNRSSLQPFPKGPVAHAGSNIQFFSYFRLLSVAGFSHEWNTLCPTLESTYQALKMSALFCKLNRMKRNLKTRKH